MPDSHFADCQLVAIMRDDTLSTGDFTIEFEALDTNYTKQLIEKVKQRIGYNERIYFRITDLWTGNDIHNDTEFWRALNNSHPKLLILTTTLSNHMCDWRSL